MKNIFIVLITFITMFLPESKVWCAVKNSDKIVTAINLSIDKSTFLINDDSPAIIAERKTEKSNNSSLWFLSIFIPGLGQSLMGDNDRSNRFFVLSYAPVVIGITLSILISIFQLLSASANSIPTTFLVLMVPSSALSLVFYIQNIFDAYDMSKDLYYNESENLSKLEDKLKTAIDNLNNIKVSGNGNISITALSF